jgi:hypothetical protein
MTDSSDGGQTDGTAATGNPSDGSDEGDDGSGVLTARRTFLGGLAGTLAAGVTFVALNVEAIREFFMPTHENAGTEAWLSRDETETDTTERVVGTVRLGSGQYTAQNLWASSSGAVLSWQVSNIQGGAVDVWVLPDDHIDRYQDDEDPRFNAALSAEGITAETRQRGEVPDGDWWVVVDNSELLGSDADDEVELDVELELTI